MALAPAFLAASGLTRNTEGDALEQALLSSYQRARAAWPEVEIPPETFARHLGERVPHDLDPAAALAQVNVEDLYLACACLEGHRGAMARLEKSFLAPVARVVAHDSSTNVEDLQQLLGERLVVATEEHPPRLAGYAGRGPLMAWVRVAAVRLAINARQGQRPDDLARSVELLALSAVTPDPDLTLLRVQCRDEFREAFSTALASLEVRERAVLRFHYIDGLAGETLARMYDVSRRTVHRWLEQSLDRLLARTREQLAQRLSLPPHELESLIQVLRSELGSTVVQELGPTRD